MQAIIPNHLKSTKLIVISLKSSSIAPLARIYDKSAVAFVQKDFSIQASPMNRAHDPDQPLHNEEFSLTKNRHDLKLKHELFDTETRNMASSLSPGPKQKFYTRWQSQIPEDSEIYGGARPS